MAFLLVFAATLLAAYAPMHERIPDRSLRRRMVMLGFPSASSEDRWSTQDPLQYEYINRGDFEQAYSLFARQSQREVSLEQYEAFFEANAPYTR